MTNHVDGRVIIITGAAGGFGRLVASKTAALGARVVAVDVNETELKSTVESITREGGEAEGVVADVTSRKQMTEAAKRAVTRFGAIDVMVNNAGVMPLALYSDHAVAADAWDRCIDINFRGVLNGIIAVHDQIGGGRLIFTIHVHHLVSAVGGIGHQHLQIEAFQRWQPARDCEGELARKGAAWLR